MFTLNPMQLASTFWENYVCTSYLIGRDLARAESSIFKDSGSLRSPSPRLLKHVPLVNNRICFLCEITNILLYNYNYFAFAMPNDDILTDDYVAGLLAKEAGDCSIKYSAMGMEAFTTNSK